jgi:hypothetical protein
MSAYVPRLITLVIGMAMISYELGKIRDARCSQKDDSRHQKHARKNGLGPPTIRTGSERKS